MPKSKAYSNPLPSMADEQRYGTKCHELRNKIREIERENQNIQLKILQSKKNISRLRIERSVLYEALAALTVAAANSADLKVSPQIQQSSSNNNNNNASANLPAAYPTTTPSTLSNPSPSIPPNHNNNNGYHSQASITTNNRSFSDAPIAHPPTSNHNNTQQQVPNRNFSRSTEPLASNGITGLLNNNSTNNTNSSNTPPAAAAPNNHHPTGSTVPPHGQYPQTLSSAPSPQVQHHPRIQANHHQLAPIATDPNSTTRYPSASNSPTAHSNHFPHHQLGNRLMSVPNHHHHMTNRYPSPHQHHHHHHHHHHSTEQPRSNPGVNSGAPNMHSGSQGLSNGNSAGFRAPDDEEEEEEAEEEEDEEIDEVDEMDESAKAPSGSALRAADDDMEIDAEADDDD